LGAEVGMAKPATHLNWVALRLESLSYSGLKADSTFRARGYAVVAMPLAAER
jgi:hypothetical protein